MTPADWLDALAKAAVHPDAASDTVSDILAGHLDGDDEVAVMKRAIEAHATYTGVTLPAWRF